MFIDRLLNGDHQNNIVKDAIAALHAHFDKQEMRSGNINLGMLPRGGSLLYRHGPEARASCIDILHDNIGSQPLARASVLDLLSAVSLLERKFARDGIAL